MALAGMSPTDTSQAEFIDKPVLERAKQSFDVPVRTSRLDFGCFSARDLLEAARDCYVPVQQLRSADIPQSSAGSGERCVGATPPLF